jgi:hypothetical protein
MPYEWVDPEVFLEYKDIELFVTYVDNHADDVNPHCFAFWEGSEEEPDHFDIREYAHLIKEVEPIIENYSIILKALIDEGYLTAESITDKKPGAEPEDLLTLNLPF